MQFQSRATSASFRTQTALGCGKLASGDFVQLKKPE